MLAGCSQKPKEPWPVASTTERPANAVVVTVGKTTTRQVERSIDVVGSLVGFEEIVISAKVEGRVKKVSHDIGDRVKPGTILLEIDPVDYQLAVKQTERAIEVEMAKLNLMGPSNENFDWAKVPMVVNARAKLDNARSRAQRTTDLLRSRATSVEENTDRQDQLQMAQAEYDNQVMLARSGWQMVRARQVELESARQKLRDATIVAPEPTWPTTGLDINRLYAVTKRSPAEGGYLRVGDEMFRLAVDQRLKLRLPVPERHVANVHVGQAVRLQTAASNEPTTGTVSRMNPSVEPLTRTFEVEAIIENREGKLRPGGFAKARIVLQHQDAALSVPLEAIVTFAGVTKVFVVENGKARSVPVQTSVQGRDWIEVIGGGLKNDEVVATSGQALLSDGSLVDVRNVELAAKPKDGK